MSIIGVLRIREAVECQYWNRATVARAGEAKPRHWRNRRKTRTELTCEQRGHSSTAGEPGRIDSRFVRAHVRGDMSDDIANVGDVIRTAALDWNVPASALRIQSRHDEPLAGAQALEAAVSGLTL